MVTREWSIIVGNSKLDSDLTITNSSQKSYISFWPSFQKAVAVGGSNIDSAHLYRPSWNVRHQDV